MPSVVGISAPVRNCSDISVLVPMCTRGVRTLRTQDTLDLRQFGCPTKPSFGTEMSYFLYRCRSVFGTLRHSCRSVPDRSAALSCSCIASPPHATSAPSIAIFRQRLKTFCIYEIIPGHSHLTPSQYLGFMALMSFNFAYCSWRTNEKCDKRNGRVSRGHGMGWDREGRERERRKGRDCDLY